MQKYYGGLDKIAVIVKEFIEAMPAFSDNVKKTGDKCSAKGIEAISLDPRYSMSPFYYDFRSQYEFILGRLQNLSAHEFTDMVLDVINKKRYYYGGCLYHFHPDAIKNIVNAIPELNEISKHSVRHNVKGKKAL